LKKVLFVASECVPFIKTGGLADVVGSLPKYFDKSKYDVRVMIPKYTAGLTKFPTFAYRTENHEFLSGTCMA